MIGSWMSGSGNVSLSLCRFRVGASWRGAPILARMPRRSRLAGVRKAARSFSRDVEVARERDPAARSLAEILLCYPGLHALWMHRGAHALYERDLRLPARLVSQLSRFMSGIEIHPGARTGPGLF